MATLALAAVGHFLIGNVGVFTIGSTTFAFSGAMAGAMVGAYLDSRVTLPALFPPPAFEGPKLDGLELGSAQEGNPAYFVVGKLAKTPGHKLWISDLIEKKNTTQTGGKGGGGGDYITYTYYAHAAVCYAWNKTHEVSRVTRIWGDGKLIYEASPQSNYTSTLLSCAPDSSYVWIFPGGPFAPPEAFYTYYLDIFSPNNGPNLAKIKSGTNKLLQVSGWTNSVNNNASPGFPVFASGKGKKNGNGFDDGTWVRVVLGDDGDPGPPAGVAESAGNTIVLYQDSPAFSKKKMDEITFYPGSKTQPVDPLMESILGVGQVPAYRGRAYFVVKKLALLDFGNRMPSFEIEMEVDPNETLQSATQKILVRGGLPQEEFDVSGLSSNEFNSYSIRGVQRTNQSLQPIFLAEDILARQHKNQLIFFHRVDAPSMTILDDRLGAYAFGSQAPGQPVQFKDVQHSDLPKRVYVKYPDVDDDFEPGSQVARRFGGRRVETLNIPYPISGSFAQEIARRYLWTTDANSRGVGIQLPPSYADLEEGYILNFNVNNRPFSVLAVDLTYGNNGVIDVDGFREEAQTLTQVGTADPALPN